MNKHREKDITLGYALIVLFPFEVSRILFHGFNESALKPWNK